MPRVVRDSDEDVETHTTRRTRASSVASSVTSVTDSPARRTTRSTKQLATIESSPESLDDSKPKTRTTRSRAATLDKGAAKNLRSRKNSNSSELSESIEIIDLESTTKRLTRKTAATAAPGTPTRTNSRTRSLRAGSEAKSTPPTRNKRVTRASSVDPLNNLNESIGTPVKRRTRASMVPAQPTVTEEQEASSENLDSTAIDVEEKEIINKSSKGKTTRKSSKSFKDTEKEPNDGKSITMIEKSFTDNSEKNTPDLSVTIEEDITNESSPFDTIVEGSSEKLNKTESIVDSTVELSKNIRTSKLDETESIQPSQVPSEQSENLARDSGLGSDVSMNPIQTIKSNNNDENDVIDVEELTESNDSTLIDDFVIVVVDSPNKNFEIAETDSTNVTETELPTEKVTDVLATDNECERDVDPTTGISDLNFKNSYVKLERTNVEEVLSKMVEEVKNVSHSNIVDKFLNSSENIVTDQKLECKDVTIGDSDITETDAMETIPIAVDDVKDGCAESKEIHMDKDNLVHKILISNTVEVVDDEFTNSNDKLIIINDRVNVLVEETHMDNDDSKSHSESEKKTDRKSVDGVEDGKFDIMLIDDDSVVDVPVVHDVSDDSKDVETNELDSRSNTVDNIPAFESVDDRQETSDSKKTRSFFDEINELETLVTENNSEIDKLVTCENMETSSEVDPLQISDCASDCNDENPKSSNLSNDNLGRSRVNEESTDHELPARLRDNDRDSSVYIIDNNLPNQVAPAAAPVEQEATESARLVARARSLGANDDDNDDELATANERSDRSTDLDGRLAAAAEEKSPCDSETELSSERKSSTSGDSPIRSNVEATCSARNENLNETTTTTMTKEEKEEIDALPDESGDNVDVDPSDDLRTNSRNSETVVPMDQDSSGSKDPSSQSIVENISSTGERENVSVDSNDRNEDEIVVKDGEAAVEGTLSVADKESSVTEAKAPASMAAVAAMTVEDVSLPNASELESSDADGEDASSPEKAERSDGEERVDAAAPKKLSGKEQKIRKQRNVVEDSDLDETSADLFQDIPAEEWNAGKADRSAASEREEEASAAGDTRNSAKSSERLSKSRTGQLDDSLSRKSLNKSRSRRSREEAEENEEEREESKSQSFVEKSEEMRTKGRKSLDKSLNLDRSVGSASNTSFKNTSQLNASRISIIEEKSEEDNTDEKMEVDDASSNEAVEFPDRSSSKLRKSLKMNDSISKNLSIKIEKLPTSLNRSKRLSIDRSDNTVERVSQSKSNESFNGNVDASLVADEGTRDRKTPTLDDSKRSKSRLSGRLNDSSRKSSLENRSACDDAMEVDEDENSLNKSNRSSNRSLNKSLNKSSNKSFDQEKQVAANVDTPLKSTDRSLKELSKSLNKSNDALEDGSKVSSESETEERANKSTNKSMNISIKSSKSSKSRKSLNSSKDLEHNFKNKDDKTKDVNKSLNVSSKSPKDKKNASIASIAKSSKDAESDTDARDSESEEEAHPETNSSTNRSLQKSIERMKYINPSKHDFSNVVRISSGSDDDSTELPSFLFNVSDSDDEKGSPAVANDDEDDEDDKDDMDSDIANEYNLAGKDISKYSDDDVPADDCRASEEESDDSEDDGDDLKDFLVSDNEIDEESADSDDDDDDDDVEDDDEAEDEDEDEDEDEGQGKEAVLKELESKKDSSLQNQSKSSTKRKSLRYESSESNDEDVDPKKNKSVDISNRENNASLSKSIKEKSAVVEVEEKKTNKSLNLSTKSTKDKSASKLPKASESENEESGEPADESKLSVGEKSVNDSHLSKDRSQANDSKTSKNKSKNVSFAQMYDSDSNSETTLKKQDQMEIQSPSESDSGEDSYRAPVTSGKVNVSLNKKLARQLECSTPKPGALKKTDFSKENLSISANKSLSARNKSVSLNDLSNTKSITRLSLADVASKSLLDKSKAHEVSLKLKSDIELVGTPEHVVEKRQAWKLVPLSQTAAPIGDETPDTKYLKKCKLNESVPVLESIKTDPVVLADSIGSSKKKKKKNKEDLSELVEKQTKKRKHLDISNLQSLDDDSTLTITKKKKKRPRIDESTIVENVEDVVEVKKKRKESKQKISDEVVREEEAPVSKKKKKKNKVQDEEVIEEERPKKKKKKSSNEEETQATSEIVVEPENSKKKKKSKRAAVAPEEVDDEAPESVGFEEARLSALNEMQRVASSAKAAKEARKKKKKQQKNNEELSQQEAATKVGLKRLPEDLLEQLGEETPVRRAAKRQKLSRTRERDVFLPSKSMFSPGKKMPVNLCVDDGFIPLSSTGGTTDFGVINLQKAKRVSKKSEKVLSFREKMLARNARQPIASYLTILKKQKAKASSGFQ